MLSLVKAFDILERLNRQPVAMLQDLHDTTGLPKPTILRILKTMVSCGYVRQVSPRGGYCITPRVATLSAGYHGTPEVIQIGARIADDLTRRLAWPAAIATLDVDAMVVRYSTIPNSPLAHVHSTLNKRLSLLARAHGRAYLAFCGETERQALLALLKRTGGAEDKLSIEAGLLSKALADARQAGYARRLAGLDAQTSTVAAPIKVGSRVVSTLGMTFFCRAVDARREAAVAKAVVAAAAAISTRLSQR